MIVWGSDIRIFQNGQPIGIIDSNSTELKFEDEEANELISPSRYTFAVSAKCTSPETLEAFRKAAECPELERAERMVEELRTMLREAEQNSRASTGRWNRKKRREFERLYTKRLRIVASYCKANGITFKRPEEPDNN